MWKLNRQRKCFDVHKNQSWAIFDVFTKINCKLSYFEVSLLRFSKIRLQTFAFKFYSWLLKNEKGPKKSLFCRFYFCRSFLCVTFIYDVKLQYLNVFHFQCIKPNISKLLDQLMTTWNGGFWKYIFHHFLQSLTGERKGILKRKNENRNWKSFLITFERHSNIKQKITSISF